MRFAVLLLALLGSAVAFTPATSRVWGSKTIMHNVRFRVPSFSFRSFLI